MYSLYLSFIYFELLHNLLPVIEIQFECYIIAVECIINFLFDLFEFAFAFIKKHFLNLVLELFSDTVFEEVFVIRLRIYDKIVRLCPSFHASLLQQWR
jgi:hypothetical protein